MVLPSPEILTEAETKVANLLKQGLSNNAIAAALGLKTKTVKYHLTSVYRKMNVKSDRQFLAAVRNA